MKKYEMLQKLISDGIEVPEMIFIHAEEFYYFEKENKLSDVVCRKIEDFIDSLEEKGYLPLVSIRCELKSITNREERAPITLLNIGLLSLKNKIETYCNIDYENMFESFKDRAKFYYSDYEAHNSVDKEIEDAIVHVYEEMKRTIYQGDKSIIVQRIVLGNYDDKSGTGICCNYPGPVDQNSYCKGVFIPKTIGMPAISGCWGPGEISLEEFACMNPKAYDELIRIFHFLEKKYGENPYIEFSCEGEKLYVLQYEIRQRYVKANE